MGHMNMHAIYTMDYYPLVYVIYTFLLNNNTCIKIKRITMFSKKQAFSVTK